MRFARFGRLSAALLAAAASGGPAGAQDGGKRLALVIGNSAYKSISPLTNPINDAKDIAAKLKTLQFEVLLATDATQAQMSSVLKEFRGKVTREHVALVFYAGHGVTLNKESFLLPIDVPAVIDADERGELRPEVVNSQLISMASVLAPLEASKIGIVFLDACRTDPAVPGVGMSLRVASLSPSRKVSVLRGTGSLEIKASPYSAGVFRAYATQLDNVASDGVGRNSPFTRALLKHMGTKGLSIQELMIRVRRSVMDETKNSQVPWEEAALNESFYFVPTAAAPTGTGQGVAAPKGQPQGAKTGVRPPPSSLPPNIGVGIGGGL